MPQGCTAIDNAESNFCVLSSKGSEGHLLYSMDVGGKANNKPLMIFNIRVQENLLELSKDRKKVKARLLFLCIFISIGFILMAIDDYYHDRYNPIIVFLMLITVFVFGFSTLRDNIRIVLYGEVLTFNKERGELLINSRYQNQIDEIARIELYHHNGDEQDSTYLDIIYIDNTKYRLDQDFINNNEELIKLGKLLGSFLNKPLVERHNR